MYNSELLRTTDNGSAECTSQFCVDDLNGTKEENSTKTKSSQRSLYEQVIGFMSERRNVALETKLKDMFNTMKSQTARENLRIILRYICVCVCYDV